MFLVTVYKVLCLCLYSTVLEKVLCCECVYKRVYMTAVLHIKCLLLHRPQHCLRSIRTHGHTCTDTVDGLRNSSSTHTRTCSAHSHTLEMRLSGGGHMHAHVHAHACGGHMQARMHAHTHAYAHACVLISFLSLGENTVVCMHHQCYVCERICFLFVHFYEHARQLSDSTHAHAHAEIPRTPLRCGLRW